MLALAVSIVLVPLTVFAADSASRQDGGDHRGGMMGGGMGETMGGSEGMGGMMQDMPAIHGLLSRHNEIQRSVEDIPNGVRTVTTSKNPNVTKLIREHVWQMKRRIEDGQPIRQMDPLFVEVFKNHQHIHMNIEDVPGGVRVEETADDARVVPLVRQHARKAVSEFAAEGMPRAMRPTPLPPGYVPSNSADHPHARGPHGCRCMGST